MYSIVLMMALSNSAVTPTYTGAATADESRYGNHGHQVYRHRKHGCCGGCSGGCHGGGHGCSGYGGGYGCSGYGGGYGGGYGCSGSMGWGGGYGCSGGHTAGYSGGYGCSGGHMAGYSSGYSGMYGYNSYYQGAPYGSSLYPSQGMPTYSQPANQILPSDGTRPANTTTNVSSTSAAPATILVTLPADARLTVDDTATSSTTGVRTLITPPLEPGKDFQYTLKAQINRDGKELTTEKQISVRAGQQTVVTLEFAGNSVAQR